MKLFSCCLFMGDYRWLTMRKFWGFLLGCTGADPLLMFRLGVTGWWGIFEAPIGEVKSTG